MSDTIYWVSNEESKATGVAQGISNRVICATYLGRDAQNKLSQKWRLPV